MKAPPDAHPGFSVHFVQYLFPDGTPADQWVERSKEIFDMAEKLWANNCRLEIENKDGMIWMSCVSGKGSNLEAAVDRLCGNGPEVLNKVDELIREAYSRFL